MTREIVLATRNPGKIKEFQRMVSELAPDIAVLGLMQFPDLPDVEETGSTFAENSFLKSREVSRFTKLPALADDSGLCIDFLGGAPGIYSARYAGMHGDDLGNNSKVLAELEGVTPENRKARFQTAVTLIFPEGHRNFGLEIIEEGELCGEIAMSPRGSSGFGYDPIFIPEASVVQAGLQTRTLGEYEFGEKDRISHRGRAMQKMAPKIVELL